MEQQKRVIVISGPTATGKSALGVALCRRLDGEIISADSMQIYRGMDIGTAKITAEEMNGVPHHMLDVAEPTEDFSVSRWVDMAAACAEDIFARGKVPVIVGGTGLYIDSLLSGRDFAQSEGNGALREQLSAAYDAMGGEAFREKLRQVDPERAEKLHPADKKRLVRALEIYELTGQTISAHDAATQALPPRWDSLRFALNYAQREDLYRRIDQRVEQMAAQGLFDEVRRLLAQGLSPESTAMQAIGYKEVVASVRGEASPEQAIALIQQNSRRYAKRQLTWLRRDKELHWFHWGSQPDVEQAAREAVALWQQG